MLVLRHAEEFDRESGCDMSTLLEHKEAIREVIDLFSNLEIDVLEQAKLVTSDVHFEVYDSDGSVMVELDGRDKLIEVFQQAISEIKTAYHLNGQQVITVDGDSAIDVHYGKAILVQEVDGKDVVVDRSYRYTDTLVLTGGAWLIKRRIQHLVLSETRPL